MDTESLLFPVGHFQGLFHEAGVAEPSRYLVGLGDTVADLGQPGFLAWAAAHGAPPGVPDRHPGRKRILEAVEGGGFEDPETVVDSLFDVGALAEIDRSTPASTVAFAGRHRVLPLLAGLGNDPAEPGEFRIGLPGRPALGGLPHPVYQLWASAHRADHLWAACLRDARSYAEGKHGDPWWRDPEALLSRFTDTLPELLAANACYLDFVEETR